MARITFGQTGIVNEPITWNGCVYHELDLIHQQMYVRILELEKALKDKDKENRALWQTLIPLAMLNEDLRGDVYWQFQNVIVEFLRSTKPAGDRIAELEAQVIALETVE